MGMRISMLLALCAAAGSASAQSVDMVATRNGKPAGSGAFTITSGPNHSYIQTIVLKLSIEGQSFELNEVEKIGFDGSTLQSETKAYSNGKVQSNTSILYNTKEAIVTDLATGAKSHFPIPPQSSVKDPAQLWFISLRPHLGSALSATTFDQNSKAWQKTTRTYVADVPVTVHGLKVTGHEVKDESGEQTLVSILDDHGLPYAFEVQGIKFTRK